MGVYIYSLRKRIVNILVDGEKTKANLFSFSYKEHWSFAFGREQARREFIANNAERTGQAAFDSPRSGYAIIGDADYDHHGAGVYANITRGTWVDSLDFPGTLVGWLHKEGKHLVIRDYSPWQLWKVLRDGVEVPEESRSVLVEGKIIHERRSPPDVLNVAS